MRFYVFTPDAGDPSYFAAENDAAAAELAAERYAGRPGLVLGSDRPPIGWRPDCPKCGARAMLREHRGAYCPACFLAWSLERPDAWRPRSSPPADRGSFAVPMDAQLGLDGSSADIAPASERLKLFEPAPAQIPGQLGLELEGGER